MDSTDFYSRLRTNSEPLRDLLKNKAAFAQIPQDWYVLVVDVKEASAAVKNGLHTDVNLAATGSIITILNTIKKISKDVKVPCFFRGDGATCILPEPVLKDVEEALQMYGNHILKTLQLELTLGCIKVSEIYKKGVTIGIAKLKLNTYLVTSVIYGNGVKVAERLIRENNSENVKVLEQPLAIHLEGMECRWEEIFPNEDDKKVLCLLVVCNDERIQSEVFVKILDEIDYVFGDLNKRTPITTVKLKLDNSLRKMRKEMYARLGKFDRGYLVQNWLITYLGSYYFKYFKGGKEYVFKVTQLSDTLVLDGSINTVFSGTQSQINKLKMVLDSLETDNKIMYAMHPTYASIISCYIEDRDEKHIHFVDGTEGGYSNAAHSLRQKLNMANDKYWKQLKPG